MRLAIRSTGLPFAGQLHHNRQLSRWSGGPLLTFRGSRAAGGGTADGSAARSRSGASRAEMTPQPADGEVHQRLGSEEMTFRVSDVAGDPASRGQRKAPDDGEGAGWPCGHAFIREGAEGSGVVVMDLAPHHPVTFRDRDS